MKMLRNIVIVLIAITAIAGRPAPPPPASKDRFDLAREACRTGRCAGGVSTLAAHTPRGEPERSLLASLVGKAVDEAIRSHKHKTARGLLKVAQEVGAELPVERHEKTIQVTSIDHLFSGDWAYLAPDVFGDVAERGEWLRADFHRPEKIRAQGLDWLRFSAGGANARDVFVIASMWNPRLRGIHAASWGDKVTVLRQTPLSFGETTRYWQRVLGPPLEALVVALLLCLLLGLITPRWLGKLLWLYRLKRLARFLFQWACWRQRAASPAALAGKAVDFARAASWRARRKMRGDERAAMLASAERALRQASLRRPRVDAWLAHILFLQGRLEDAERAAKQSLLARPINRARIELARLAIARGKLAAAASHLGAVKWWQALSADTLYLRAIVAFHAGKLTAARRSLFFARRSAIVRKQSALLVAALRERLGQTHAAEKAASRAALAGVGVVSASTWLAQRARQRGDQASAKRWAQAGLRHRPDNAALALEAALADDAGIDRLVAVVKRYPKSVRTLAVVFSVAAEKALGHPYLDARLDDEDDGTARVWEAKGDYALSGGDRARALEAWSRAAKDDDALSPLVRLRTRVFTEEALARGAADLALELARAGNLAGPLLAEAHERALYQHLERSRRGLSLGSVELPTSGAATARALYHLLRGDVNAARPLLSETLRPEILPLIEHDRELSADEVRAFGETGEALLAERVTPLHDAFARLRAAIAAADWSAAHAAFIEVRGGLRLGASEHARNDASVVHAILVLATNPELAERRAALETLRTLHSDPRVRGLCEHELAVATSAAIEHHDGRRLPSSRWRNFAQSWDRVFASQAYKAHLRQRVLELDDARLDTAALEEAIEETQDRLGRRLRPFLENRATDGQPVPGWVHESPLAERAALAYVDELTRTAEAALASAEAQRNDKALAPHVWNHEGAQLCDLCDRLGVVGVAPERTQALRERASSALINLGVDANAIGDYVVAIESTTAALRMTRTPENQRLCTGNIAIYENNRMRHLTPPGS